MIKIRKILVPTDFSEESLKALRYAVEFIEALMGVEILLVHVREAPIYPAVAFAGVTGTPNWYDQVDKECSERLQKLIETEVPKGVSARWILQEGTAYASLAQTAKDEEVDLIIIATHGYTGLKHMMLGSVAEKVVRWAPCPVLTVREAGREFVRTCENGETVADESAESEDQHLSH